MKKRNIQQHIFPFLILLTLIVLLLCLLIKLKRDPSQKNLWTHLVFIEAKIVRKKVVNRTPVIVYGLFNQLFALFTAADLAKLLGRNLIVGDFYVNFANTRNIASIETKNLNSVPLSKIVDLDSVLVPTKDWNGEKNPTPSRIGYNVKHPPNSIKILQQEDNITDLEVGCCFMFPLDRHVMDHHIQNLRFHPIFYEIISSFLASYPKYQVVHYRLENDFTDHFFKDFKFNNVKECRSHYFKLYQDALKKNFDPKIPTLVVSHYYKDLKQKRDHDLQWDNLVHFRITPKQKIQLCDHLQLPISTPMREVDAIIDFMLCTSANVYSFIGTEHSTFSGSVRDFRKNHRCFMINPSK